MEVRIVLLLPVLTAVLSLALKNIKSHNPVKIRPKARLQGPHHNDPETEVMTDSIPISNKRDSVNDEVLTRLGHHEIAVSIICECKNCSLKFKEAVQK